MANNKIYKFQSTKTIIQQQQQIYKEYMAGWI
jgi:hypothetical protein